MGETIHSRGVVVNGHSERRTRRIRGNLTALLLQACLGLEVSAQRGEIALQAPRLPAFIDSMEILHLSVGHRSADLRLQRYGKHVGIDVAHKHGDLDVRVRM